MKVIHLSGGPLSGAPYRLVQVQRLGGIDARLLSVSNRQGERRVYPHDVLIEDDPELIERLLAEADVVHYHNRWQDNYLFEQYPWAWGLVRGKPSVIQFHSHPERVVEEALREPSLLKLVVAQYHVRFYPECRPVPNAVPIDDPLHRPLWIDNEPPIVAFTPPDCHENGWYSKGCSETLRLLRGGFRHRFLTDAPWRQAMEVRRPCDVAIDEVVTGSYHMCSLESLSQGLATVAGLDGQTLDALERVTGTREHPWVVATPDTLGRELAKLVADGAYRAAKRREARSYMERYWNPGALTAMFTDIYWEARERAAA